MGACVSFAESAHGKDKGVPFHSSPAPSGALWAFVVNQRQDRACLARWKGPPGAGGRVEEDSARIY